MGGRAAALAVVLLASVLAGCLGPGDNALIVVASAPRLANGMTVAVAVQRGLLGGGDGDASYWVARNGEVLYPPGGVVGGVIPIVGAKGSAFIPYANFVVDNGDYEVTVEFQGQRAMARASVDKWVNWVYVLPYVRNDTLVADLVLERSPGEPNDRIFAAGQINVEVRYRGEDGADDHLRATRTLVSDGLDSFQRFRIAIEDLNSTERNRGYYSVEATFHNYQANGNNNVPMDPTLQQANPPTNWVYLELPDRCTSPVSLPPPLPHCPRVPPAAAAGEA